MVSLFLLVRVSHSSASEFFRLHRFWKSVSLISGKQITLWFLSPDYIEWSKRDIAATAPSHSQYANTCMPTSKLMYELHFCFARASSILFLAMMKLPNVLILAYTDFRWIHYTSDVGIVTEPFLVAALTLFVATSRYSVFHFPILICTVLPRWLVPSFDLYIGHLFIICHLWVCDTSLYD